ncbi:hypothetical protein FLX27_21995 [Agrobacterium tumefaciens]|nr:hypothetical protein [Agrobacterium tumefaciens]TQN59587.1 hypothetical protein FLX27_21995 [Agrobacterium tumefaciens]
MKRRTFLTTLFAVPLAPIVGSKMAGSVDLPAPYARWGLPTERMELFRFSFPDGLYLSEAKLFDPRKETLADFEKRVAVKKK